MVALVAAEAKIGEEEGDRELLSIRRRHPMLVVQLMTLRRFPSNRALMMIGEQTLRASRTDSLVAAKPEVDLMLRITGTSQIATAMRKSGYRAKGRKLLVALGPTRKVARLREELAKSPNYSILENDELQDADLAAVERAALLGTRS